MVINGMQLCDFCFGRIESAGVCPNCGFTHENYYSEPDLLAPGTILAGKYVIGKKLGRGGFGATYLAYSHEIKNIVAIKEYFPVNVAYRLQGETSITIVSEEKRDIFEKGASGFFEEAKIISKFNKNKNIVSVYELFYANNTAYYAMEYLHGTDLKKYVEQHGGKLSEAETVRIMRGMCNALVIVHSTQTVHRDIAPDNVFICSDGTVKLIDFGASKQIVSHSNQINAVVVKQGFAPIEQYSDKNGKQGVWTDIYAAGATMYYCLTGKVPPDAMSRIEEPELNFNVKPEISQQVRDVVSRCMETKVENRYLSALEMLDGLATIPVPEEKPKEIKPEEPKVDSNKKQNKTGLIAACVAAAVAIGGVALFLRIGKNKDDAALVSEELCTLCGGSHIASECPAVREAPPEEEGPSTQGGPEQENPEQKPPGSNPDKENPGGQTNPEKNPPQTEKKPDTKPQPETKPQPQPEKKPETKPQPQPENKPETKPQPSGKCPVCGSSSHSQHPASTTDDPDDF